MSDKSLNKGKKKERKYVPAGVAYVNSTFNNTLITVTDMQGNVLAWASAGNVGFKGARKSTPYAAQIAAEKVGAKLKDLGLKTLDIKIKGPGSGREAAIRSLQSSGFIINSIYDVTPIPHNGCRPPKRRRV